MLVCQFLLVCACLSGHTVFFGPNWATQYALLMHFQAACNHSQLDPDPGRATFVRYDTRCTVSQDLAQA